MSTLVRDLHQNLTAHYEGMYRYPIVYYFHNRRPNRSIPNLFWFIGASAAAVRWCLPPGHPATANPWLPGLIEGFDDTVKQVEKQFLPDEPAARVQPVTFEEFRSAPYRGCASDERLGAFLEAETFMRGLAVEEGPEDLPEAYGRYVEWHDFTSRGRAFVQAASGDLGLEPEEIYTDAARSRF